MAGRAFVLASLCCGLSQSVQAQGIDSPATAVAGVPDYNREIRPLLSKACFRCHGADEKKRKAKLRLDDRDLALAKEAFVPGKANASELIARITSTDPDELMPPPEKGDRLTSAEIELLTRWIEAGAPYAKHWAFEKPIKPTLPDASSGAAPIDQWVRAELTKHEMSPAEPASRETWLRRVTFDLTGLPPTLEEIDAFLKDDSDSAYETGVDRLLKAPAFGEQMAREWLDLARYADTYGRHEDADCITWPYRDWVIKAINENLPYDQFVTWQTAGDLMPNPTRDQLIATCFNRLPQQSNEAGSNPEEFRLEQVADRVHTNATTFLGLTMQCARCHDHKYDPLSQHDYYSMSSFFDNIDELGLFAVFTGGVPSPSILLYSPEQEQRLKTIHDEVATLTQSQESERPKAEARYQEWLKEHSPPRQRQEPDFWGKIGAFFSAEPLPLAEATKPRIWLPFESFDKEKKFANLAAPELPGMLRRKTPIVPGKQGQAIQWDGDNILEVPGFGEIHRTESFSLSLWVNPQEHFEHAVLAHRCRSGIDSAWRGFELKIEDGRAAFALCHFSPGNEIRIRSEEPLPIGEWTHLTATYDGSSRAGGMTLYWNGQRIENPEIAKDNLTRDIVYREEWGDAAEKDQVSLSLALAGRHNDGGFSNGLMDEFYFFDRELTAPEVSQLALIPDQSTTDDWFPWYLREVDEPWTKISKAIQHLREEENTMSGEVPDLMVMQPKPGPRRPTHLLNRGQFDQPAEEVFPETPASLSPYPEGAPRNRLGLAQWLVSSENPLTARVEVNRLWQHFFGRGLVGTSEDFGTQGEYPTHPELLDWLAVHFRDDLKWDVKALCREIVLTETYRQASTPSDSGTLKNDPENRWLAHGPRSRLPAESLRDLALAASGLLEPKIGGPSVMPYQPDRLWEESGTQHIYVQDHGKNLYRRSLYTFWRRTLPPPSMTVFDAPTREYCTTRRIATATPLQALVLMNDPQFIEAARVMAEALVRKFPDDLSARVETAFRRLTSQRPSPEQRQLLTDYVADETEKDRAHPAQTEEFLSHCGEFPRDESLPAAEVAATTSMVRMLFGFSETVTKP